MTPARNLTTMRRNKSLMIVGLLGVLALGGIFATLTVKALWIRSATGSVFNKYVIDHGIGHAEVADDASGFQRDFCVLHLNHPIADGQLQAETLSLMREYHDLDGGDSLSIQYSVPGTGKTETEADAVYDAASKTVTMTLNEGGQKRVAKQSVAWPDSGDGS